MSDDVKRDCTRCHGSRSITETHTEQDLAMGTALGAALGMGYFPSTRTVTKQVTCPQCHGSGKQP
ncbi:MAG: hypothetical protein JWN38_17 [Candidatus Saccharibacteria bacterium]|nr:hypothetical protein [Candidatus Saccharibacteria bacterium]